MRAIQVSRFGGPEVLVEADLPDPVPSAGEVVVAVEAADTLYLDTLVRRGPATGPWAVHPPYVPGAGVAGRVVAVGADVDPAWSGRRVVAKSGAGGPRPEVETVAAAAARTAPTGGYAQYALARATALIAIPDTVDAPTAAALVNDGMTAVLLGEVAAPTPGETVLVTPAAGGLGCLLVQRSRRAGARVVAGAGSRRKLDLARELGAEIVVDYTEADWPEQVIAATGGRGCDVIYDGVGGEVGRVCVSLAARGARFVSFGVPGGGFTAIDHAEVAARDVVVASLLDIRWTAEDEARLPRTALEEAASGRLHPHVGRLRHLGEAAALHADIEARAVLGKSLLLP